MKSCKKELIPSNACGIVSIILKNRPLIGFAKTHFDSCMNDFQFPGMTEKTLENLKETAIETVTKVVDEAKEKAIAAAKESKEKLVQAAIKQ